MRRNRQGASLSADHGSLARGVSSPVPGTIFVMALTGGFTLRPGRKRTVTFGRNSEDVHVCLGADDQQVSRHQGTLLHQRGQWWVSNVGQLPIRFDGSRLLFRDEDPIPLGTGYTPLFVRGSRNREHLLEIFVTGPEDEPPTPLPGDITRPPRIWWLSDDERLALVVLGQRYLLHHPRPQPLTWEQTYRQLSELRPDGGWTKKKTEHAVNSVRTRLSEGGVPWLTREEVGEPVGNTLNDNMLRELLLSTTLVPLDLALIDLSLADEE